MDISLLGSTGSIGTQSLEVIKNINQKKNKIKVKAICVNKNIDLLEKQIFEFKPEYVCVFDKKACEILKNKLKKNIKIMSGLDGLIEIAKLKVDLCVNALSGHMGLMPTVESIKSKNNIALANKESLVMAGELVMREAKKNNIKITPIDSEHSAIMQILAGNEKSLIEKLYLTASGGPLHDKIFNNNSQDKFYIAQELDEIKIHDALNHPTWQMGKKISIDSASLINKGFEILEAIWLFNIKPDKIKVLVHRESLIHSMIEFADGNIIAQLGPHDMRLPIQYALSPKRIANNFSRLDFDKINSLNFAKPNKNLIGIELCREAFRIGGTMPGVLCIANDLAVESFLRQEILFGDIYRFIKFAMNNHKVILNYELKEILSLKTWVENLFIKFKAKNMLS